MKAARHIVSIVILIVCAVVGYNVFKGRALAPKIGDLNDRYEAAASPEEFEALKAEYQALLPDASGKAQEVIETQIAGCEAWLAFYDTTGKPSIAKFRDAIPKMKRAQELSGDREGVWAANIRTFEERLKESLGPREVGDMRGRLAALKEKPFPKARRDLETLYLWKTTWERQGEDEVLARQADNFEAIRQYLLENYQRLFEESLAKAQDIEFTDAEMKRINPDMDFETPLGEKVDTLAAIQGPLAQIARLDREKGEALRKKHADILARARRISAMIQPEE